MDLWIRTQDRENTVKIINGYGLKYNDKKTIIANYQPDFTDKYDGYYEVLGTYKTKEKALEVLDEIQKILINNAFVKKTKWMGETVDIIPNPVFVYEMPKE